MNGRVVRRPGGGSATVIVDGGEMLVAFHHNGRAIVATRSHRGAGGPCDAEVLGLVDILVRVAKL